MGTHIYLLEWGKKKTRPKVEVGGGRGTGYPPVAILRYHTLTITEEKGWKLGEGQVASKSDEIAINLSFSNIYRIGHLKWVSCHIKGKRQKKFKFYLAFGWGLGQLLFRFQQVPAFLLNHRLYTRFLLFYTTKITIFLYKK